MHEYEICMMGPSRCGKTTLLASIIHEFMKFSEKVSGNNPEYLKLDPLGKTYGKIQDRINSIMASTREGHFLTGGLAGTQVHETFEVGLNYQKKAILNADPEFKMTFHDFPGGWLKDKQKIAETRFNEAQILIMPVDASLVFQASRPNEIVSATRQLDIATLTDVAKTWAHARKADKTHPGLFILAPVKCESYFADNLPIGLQVDKRVTLQSKIMGDKYFLPIKEAIRSINPATSAWYLPVDTIGCCFVSDKNWVPSDTYGVELEVTYKIPPHTEWTPYGPAQIMLKILEYLIQDHEDNKGFFEWVFSSLGWNTDLGKNVATMRQACDVMYKRGAPLW